MYFNFLRFCQLLIIIVQYFIRYGFCLLRNINNADRLKTVAKLRIYYQFIGDSEMKTRTLLFVSALLALTSCGSAAQYANDTSGQRYQDGIYYTPKTSVGETAVKADNDLYDNDVLVAKTKNSPIFLKSGEKVDTLFIPDNKVAKIDFNKTDNTTSVYLFDNGWDTWAAYQPWYASSWYSWHRPFYSSIYWGANPWYYGGWYDPWY